MLTNMRLIDSAPILAKLRARQPEQHGTEYDFAAALADKLPKEQMYCSSFVLEAKVLLYDMAWDAPGLPARLRGFPAPALAVLDMGLRDLARRVFDGDDAAGAVEMIDAAEGR